MLKKSLVVLVAVTACTQEKKVEAAPAPAPVAQPAPPPPNVVLEQGKAFQETAAKEEGAIKTPSGLIYKEIKAGAGAQPTAANVVKVHYRGTLIDGVEFDSSYSRNEPIEFPLSGVIPCWTEGVQKMKVGGKSKLVCPAEIAYGKRGAGPLIKPDSTLVFEVELLGVR